MFLSAIDVTRTYTSAEFRIGSLAAITTSSGTKIYKFFLFNNGAGDVAAAVGNVAYIYAPSGTSSGVTTCTSDLSDSAEIGAGVFASVPADGEYCWLQVTGLATLTTALTAGADGDPLTPTGATDGTLDVTTASTDHICAIAVDASAKIVLCQFPL